jgi:poly-gamma-glutamate synthesis protein (capsule biosynthesis protein)
LKLAFTGDINFGNMEKFSADPFRHVADEMSKLNCVVNLEAVLLPQGFTGAPAKQKMCLRADEAALDHLIRLRPLLVNMSNNHINDYGNYGAANTMQLLRRAGLNCFGAGYSDQEHNVFALQQEKILFLTYTTARFELMQLAPLYDDIHSIGPKEFSLDLLRRQIRGYEDYTKIVLLHWGREDVYYPLPTQRQLAREMIDAGVDLIIGNHPHVIQSYEQYRGRWIFYCLGHFFFPHFVLDHRRWQWYRETYFDYQHKGRNISLVPVFEVEPQGIVLKRIRTIRADRDFQIRFVNKTVRHNRFMGSDSKRYQRFYTWHAFFTKWLHRLKWPLRKVSIGRFYLKWHLLPLLYRRSGLPRLHRFVQGIGRRRQDQTARM